MANDEKVRQAIALLQESLEETEPDDHRPYDLGRGMFLRRLQDLDPLTTGLDWVCVPVIQSERKKCNRDTKWYQKARDAGLVLTAFDWMPDADNWEKGLDEAVEFAAAQGCVSFILNAEKEFRKHQKSCEEYARFSRSLCDHYGIKLGFVSYSVPATIKDLNWEAFAEYCDFGIPEIYDRYHELDPDYPIRAIEGYEEVGFKVVIPACGIYRFENDKARWRTAREVDEHLSLFPDTSTLLAWALRGQVPTATMEAYLDY